MLDLFASDKHTSFSHPQRSGNARWPPLGCDPAGSFFGLPMRRVIFLVDGFNLYHSIKEAVSVQPNIHFKWLNLHALCSSLLHLIGNNAQLAEVHYFSALATHRQIADPQVILRHQSLLDCLRATGVHIELGRFKAKSGACPICRRPIVRHEEKETDVAIAVRLIDLLHADRCDTAVLVTGDTDLAPAIRLARQRFPDKGIVCAFPYARKNNELAGLSTHSFVIRATSYARHQFPDPFRHPDGRLIFRPASW